MNRKKIKVIITSIIMILIVIAVYIFILSTPSVELESITIESLGLELNPDHPNYVKGANPASRIESFVNDGREHSTGSIQVFLESDNLPSNDANDYAIVTFKFNVTNSTVFDAMCKYLMVNDYDKSSDIFVVTCDMVEYYYFDRLATSEGCEYKLFIYTKGKTHEEIEKAIESIEFQMPFSNDIIENRNKYFDIGDIDVEFVGL